MRDHIFNEIYAKFTRGEKLKRYDFYVREQAAVKYLKMVEEERKKQLAIENALKNAKEEEKRLRKEKLRLEREEMENAAK
jgi:hypothetical protein